MISVGFQPIMKDPRLGIVRYCYTAARNCIVEPTMAVMPFTGLIEC